MRDARLKHPAVLLQDGKVLVAGGLGQSGFLTSAELYDPSSGTWSSTGSMTQGRGFHAAVLLNDGKALVVGGLGFNAAINLAEVYDPTTGKWSPTSP
jgi:hypothetical protein